LDVIHIPGVDNTLCDSISRFNLDECGDDHLQLNVSKWRWLLSLLPVDFSLFGTLVRLLNLFMVEFNDLSEEEIAVINDELKKKFTAFKRQGSFLKRSVYLG
jgi:hypothetical protein